MRTEELEQEARMFDRENECFIHVQRAGEGPYALLVTGDPQVIAQGVYNILRYMESEFNISVEDNLKIMKKAHRAITKRNKSCPGAEKD